ncbi:hypothetical protein [Leptolyngbya sp. CCY15150]|uniref:hypothetical protein n=1 Tax=Leptolyngbya sp. CCY15150 TaxID=2767772 RepID=UPI0019508C9F|nr:hypothetical protein [Leptolyngbya sp. CCY15150]
MTDSTSTQTITQQDIDILLERLKALRAEIQTARKAISPLEENLKLAFEAFQIVVGGARRHCRRLQAEIGNLRTRIHSLNGQDDDLLDFDLIEEDTRDDVLETTQVEKDPEAVEKDILYEHLLNVLDSIDDADLFANLQTLCQDPTVSLAEVLEQSPWELVWQARPVQESLLDQHRRLQRWEASLLRQVETLTRVEDRLRNDSRYGLWQQQQKGAEVWEQFLQQALEQQEDQNQELEAELETLRQEWEQLRSALL